MRFARSAHFRGSSWKVESRVRMMCAHLRSLALGTVQSTQHGSQSQAALDPKGQASDYATLEFFSGSASPPSPTRFPASSGPKKREVAELLWLACGACWTIDFW